MCSPTRASSYSDGSSARAAPARSRAAPSDCSHSDSHAPLNPVWPVSRTRRPHQNSGSIGADAKAVGIFTRIAASSASTSPHRAAARRARSPRHPAGGVRLRAGDGLDGRDDRRGRARVRDRGGGQPRDERPREPATMEAVMAATLAVPDGQPLVWALHALGHPQRDARLRTGPDGRLLRARGARAGRRSTCTAGAATPSASCWRRRLRERFPGLRSPAALAPVHAADARGGRAAAGRHQRLGRAGRVGRHRTAQAGAVDAPDAPAPAGAAAGGRRRRVRLPRRARPRRRRRGCSATAWSGPTG